MALARPDLVYIVAVAADYVSRGSKFVAYATARPCRQGGKTMAFVNFFIAKGFSKIVFLMCLLYSISYSF